MPARITRILFVVFCVCAAVAHGQLDDDRPNEARPNEGQFDEGASAGAPRLEQLPQGAVLRLIPTGEESAVYQLRFSPSGRLIATRDRDQVVRVWEMPDAAPSRTSLTERFVLTGHVDRIGSLEFSLDERMLVTSSPGPSEKIHVWGLHDGNLLRRIPDHPGQLAFDTNGSLVTAGPTGFATYDVQSGQPVPSRDYWFPKRFTNILAIRPRQNLFAYAISTQRQKSTPHEVYIRHLETGAVVYHETNPNQIASVEIASDGRHAAICYRCKKNGVSIVSLASGVAPFLLPDHNRQTYVSKFSPDGRILATASWDGQVRIWDVLAGVQIASVTASRGHALAVDFSPANRWFATTGSSTTGSSTTGSSTNGSSTNGSSTTELSTTGAEQQGVSTLVWDMRRLVFGITTEQSTTAMEPTANAVGVLATREAVDAYRAIGRLFSMGAEGVELARRFIDPLTIQLTDDDIDRLVGELGSDSYQERQAAYQSLLRVRRLAADRLTIAMRRAPTLEIELRLKRLLSTNSMTSLVSDSEYRQLYRLVQFLELSGSEQARSLISKLAEGHSDGRISELAHESLKRMASTLESDRDA